MSDKRTALLALLTQREPVSGHCPDNEQLAAYVEHGLSTNDASHIQQHLLRCATCYESWKECCDMVEQFAMQPTKQKNVAAQKIWSWLGMGVVAMAGLVAIVIQQSGTLDSHYRQGLQEAYILIGQEHDGTSVMQLMQGATRAIGNKPKPVSDSYELAYSVGMTRALKQLGIASPAVALHCRPEQCDPLFELAHAYGEWTALSLSACIKPARHASGFWTIQANVYNDLIQQMMRLKKDILALNEPLAGDSTSVCGQAKKVFLQHNDSLVL